MTDFNDAWNEYINTFGQEPKNATQLQKFTKSPAGTHVRNLSYKDSQIIFNTNKGKGKLNTTSVIKNKPIIDKGILIVLLCGLPGSGKTTLAKHFEQILCTDNANNIDLTCIIPKFKQNKTKITYNHICYDSFLFKSLTTNNKNDNNENIVFDNKLWKQSRDAAFIKTESLIVNHIKNKMDDFNNDLYSLIFIDDNMYFRSMRYKFYKLAKQYATGFSIIYVNTNKNECIKRNNKRKGFENVQTSVIQRMSHKFQPPNSNKYAWEYQNCFTFIPNNNNTEHKINDNDTYNALYKQIYESWTKIPVINEIIIDENKQMECRKANMKNLKHQSDLKLRKAMSIWMKLLKDVKNIKISNISKQIVSIKKNILQDVSKYEIENEQELNIMLSGFEQEFNEMVSQYLDLFGVDVTLINGGENDKYEYEIKQDWKPTKASTANLTFNFFADTTRIYWNKTKVMERSLWEEYLKVYQHLTAVNHKEMSDQYRTKHVHVAIVSIAMYRALKKVKKCEDKEIREQIKGMFHSMLKNIFRGQKNKLRRSNNAWVSFKDFAKNGTESEYGTFEPEFIRNDDDALFWNFHKCVFHEICVKNDAVMVGPMLCDYDYILAEYISEWITFKRDKTIACGDKMCTFRYCKNESVKDIEDWFM